MMDVKRRKRGKIKRESVRERQRERGDEEEIKRERVSVCV